MRTEETNTPISKRLAITTKLNGERPAPQNPDEKIQTWSHSMPHQIKKILDPKAATLITNFRLRFCTFCNNKKIFFANFFFLFNIWWNFYQYFCIVFFFFKAPLCLRFNKAAYSINKNTVTCFLVLNDNKTDKSIPLITLFWDKNQQQ